MTCFCADEGGAAADTLKVVRRTYMRPECRSAAFRAVKGRILHAADRRGRERPQERDGRRQCHRKTRLRLFGGRTALTEAAFGESRGGGGRYLRLPCRRSPGRSTCPLSRGFRTFARKASDRRGQYGNGRSIPKTAPPYRKEFCARQATAVKGRIEKEEAELRRQRPKRGGTAARLFCAEKRRKHCPHEELSFRGPTGVLQSCAGA